MGFDQGSACRAALARVYARAPLRDRLRWRLGVLDADVARTARDVARHFPRHSEALDGLARGAGVPRAWLDARLARTLRRPASLGGGPGIAVAAPSGGAAALLALALPDDWQLRRARPEGGIACLELAPTWFSGALAAVSQVGLAAAVIPRAGDAGPGACAAPAALLVQDALHRTDSLAGALEWCLHRPAGGSATLLFADANGEVAGVSVEAGARSLLRPAAGLLVEAATPERARGITKRLVDGPPADAEVLLARSLDAPAVALDPRARQLVLRSAGGETEVAALVA